MNLSFVKSAARTAVSITAVLFLVARALDAAPTASATDRITLRLDGKTLSIVMSMFQTFTRCRGYNPYTQMRKDSLQGPTAHLEGAYDCPPPPIGSVNNILQQRRQIDNVIVYIG